jgi:putative peptidoglycan lipid II flippase
MSTKTKGLATSAVALMGVTLFSKILGFLRDVALASSYGAGAVSDAYLMALNIPTVVFALISTSLATSFIPMYTEIEEQKGEKESLKFTNNVISIVFIISAISIILAMIFTEPLVKLFAMGFEGETLDLTIQFTRIFMLGVGFVGVSYILKSYLEIKGKFVITGLMTLPYNLLILVSIVASVKFGITTLAVGTLIALLSQLLIELPCSISQGLKYKPSINLKDENLKKMAILIVPILFGASVAQLNSIIDKNLASTLAAGSLSAMNYAYKLNIFVTGIFIASITSVVYPLFSRLTSENNVTELKKAIVTALNSMSLIVVPVSIGAFILAEPIVQVLFERGEFTHEHTVITAGVLACYAIGMLATGFRDIIVRVFYSLQDTKTPMANSVLCVVFNIIFNLVLIKYLKASGLALASSLAVLFSTIILTLKLRKKIGKFNGKLVASTVFKTCIAGALMSFTTLMSYNALELFNQKIALFAAIFVGAITYGIAVFILKVDSCEYVLNIVKNKIGNKLGKKIKSNK